MKRNNILLMFFAWLCHSSFSSQMFDLDPYNAIKTHVSSRDFNRLAIDGDRISQLFFDRDQFFAQLDQENGQVFIKPVSGEATVPLHFAITTEKKKTQDFLFTFKDISSRTLVLVAKPKKPLPTRNACQEKAINLLGSLKAGEKLDFVIATTKIPVKKGWKLKRLKYVTKDKLMGHVLTIKNVSGKTQLIGPSDLWRTSVAAISIEKESLRSGEHTTIYMVTSLGGLL